MCSAESELFYSFIYQALAELYVIDGQHEKAFALYADVRVC